MLRHALISRLALWFALFVCLYIVLCSTLFAIIARAVKARSGNAVRIFQRLRFYKHETRGQTKQRGNVLTNGQESKGIAV
jgi:hypothetical protein